MQYVLAQNWRACPPACLRPAALLGPAGPTLGASQERVLPSVTNRLFGGQILLNLAKKYLGPKRKMIFIDKDT
jgi:hypothetical protein